MEKIYAVAIRWVATTADPIRIDQALDPVGNWFRYNTDTWFVATNQAPITVRAALQRVLKTSDSVVIVGIDPYDVEGWAPPEVWRWLSARRDPLMVALKDYAGAPRT